MKKIDRVQQEKDEKFRKAQDIILKKLRELEVLKDVYDINSIYHKVCIADVLWDSFAIEVTYFVADNTEFKQHIERFQRTFLSATKTEMIHYELVQELEMRNVRKARKPIQWLKDIDNERFLGIPRPKRIYDQQD